MNPNKRPHLAREKVEAIEWLLELFCHDNLTGTPDQRPDPSDRHQVDSVKERIRIVGDLNQALKLYKEGAYFDTEARTRLRGKGQLWSGDSYLALQAVGRSADKKEVEAELNEDTNYIERLDNKYRVIAPRIIESFDQAVDEIVESICGHADYKKGVKVKFRTDPEPGYVQLCHAVAKKLSTIPVVTDDGEEPRLLPFGPEHWEIQRHCTMFLHAAVIRPELACMNRVHVSIPLDAPLEETIALPSRNGEASEGNPKQRMELTHGVFAIMPQIRKLVETFISEREKVRAMQEKGESRSKIPRFGRKIKNVLYKLDLLRPNVIEYLRSAKSTKFPGDDNNAGREKTQLDDWLEARSISPSDIVAMLEEAEKRLIAAGVKPAVARGYAVRYKDVYSCMTDVSESDVYPLMCRIKKDLVQKGCDMSLAQRILRDVLEENDIPCLY